ncbi:hypothetical protein [Candidatus Arsenophonus triatominarum]|uniref:hypothetical protein n=1 Tax=Candidatus Arsenophonus triatominarum TaxID=57911 RepID=UPI0007C5A3FF|nr:hypothetical protein [Candidatus Arsenophonus triatominarum]
MERKSVFVWSDNKAGFVQAVIVAADFPVFKKMGFVSSVDEVKEPKKTPEKSNEPKKEKGTKDEKAVN